jgi:TolB-like protein
MKKLILLASILLFLSSCSTYYGKYDYNQYFQNNEPFITVETEEDAAFFIAKKLARGFRRTPLQTIAVLNFTDEYGDRLNRGVFFADMVVSGLSYFKNPVVVERESLYELVKERELSQTNLIENRGSAISSLTQADYILSGRILRGKHEDMISVRCFRVGTGEVVYASTVSIDYTPDAYVPVSPPPHGPIIIVTDPHGSSSKTDPQPEVKEPEPDPEPQKKPQTKPSDGTEGKGKIDLDNIKKTPSDQYQNKKKPVAPTVKKPVPNTTNESVLTKKKAPVVKNVKSKAVEVKEKDPLVEEKEEVKSTTTSSKSKKKSSTVKK